MVDVINALKSDKKVYVIAAPATEGQFGANITMGSWKKAMQEVGFNGFIEAGLGGDMTAASEAAEWVEAYKAGEKKVTSCCPDLLIWFVCTSQRWQIRFPQPSLQCVRYPV